MGVIVQLGVLIFSRLITYFPSLKLKKKGQTPVRYAYAFTASGTIILVLRMLICSHVVEQRTVEDVFQMQSSQGHIFWLQRGGEVGDQQFDSFAMFARGSRNSIRTSRLIDFSKIDSEHKLLGGLVRSLARPDWLWKNSKMLATDPTTISSHHLIYKIIATFGCLTSVFGFVIQFIGLRGMHWLATIAQLAATMMMTGVRAWVRRDLALRPKDQKLSFDHELDWIATRIVRDYARLWPDMKDHDEQCLIGEDDVFWDKDCWKWGIVSGISTDGYNLQLLTPQVSNSHSVVMVRKRLGSLSNWLGPFSDLAVSVATVIEAVMNSICSFSEENYLRAESIYWSVNSGTNSRDDDRHEQIYLKLSKVGPNGPWKADATEIEAVLSLWLYSVQHKERGFTSLTIPKGNEQVIPEEDWLRHGDAAIRRDCLRFLGHCRPSTCRDLVWYMGSQASVISVVEEGTKSGVATNNRNFGDTDVISADNHRVVGFRDNRTICATDLPTTSVARFKRSMYEPRMSEELLPASSEMGATGSLSNVDDFAISLNQLAVFSDHDLKMLFAQDLFSSFMWAIAKKINPVNGKTTVHLTETGTTSDTKNWKKFKLENSKLSIALQAFEKAKLGSFEDACLCMIPPLSRAEKLPDALPVIRHAQQMAEDLELEGRLQEAADIYISLFQVGKTFHLKQLFPLRTMAILSEFLALINNKAKGRKKQLYGFEGIYWIFDQKLKLRAQLRTASQSQLEILSYLYRLQGREDMNELLGAVAYPSDETQHRSEWFELCGFTDLHPVVPQNWSFYHRIERESVGYERDYRDLLGWTPLHYVATGKWQSEDVRNRVI